VRHFGAQASVISSTGGYYLNGSQAGESPGQWWGPEAQALGLSPGQIVQRKPYDAVYQQIDPAAGSAGPAAAAMPIPRRARHLRDLAELAPDVRRVEGRSNSRGEDQAMILPQGSSCQRVLHLPPTVLP